MQTASISKADVLPPESAIGWRGVYKKATIPHSGVALGRRVAKRSAQVILTLWVTVTLLFLAQVVLPGDRATIYLNVHEGYSATRTPEELAPVNKEFGFDRPILQQYASYLGGIARGDLGMALQSRRPVTELIREQIGATALLAAVAIGIAWILMIVWTLLTAGRARWISRIGAVVEATVAGMPYYWLGFMLLLGFAVHLSWFPVLGGSSWGGLWLPALTLALPLSGFLGQAVRAEYERALSQPHILSSRARGTHELRVRIVHALRPALIPAITLTGWALGTLVSGAVIVETVFSRPGIGALLVSAVELKEFELISGVILLVSAVYIVITFLTDWLYRIVDPRISLDARSVR